MPGRVADKVVIVTGGASGLGRAASRRLCEEGARVVIADVQEELGQKTVAELGDRARFVRHDVTSEAAWEDLVADTVATDGRLDGLVNNAGIVIPATIEDARLEDWERIQAVNSTGVFLGCKHAVRAMAAGDGGSIVNLSSVAGLVGAAPYAAYSASKGAVRSLTQTVAAHCVQQANGVRCNSIHPGGMDTPMIATIFRDAGIEPDQAMRGQTGIPLGQPDDVAWMVVYLVSDESRYVNGSALVVDAGLTAS